ncbi:MAG: FAD-dependent oxidoreductase [Kordiimonadaceae bacterium]|nr:FAD-dependent oxidoreductase [Kordiimonadaceae bacterium]
MVTNGAAPISEDDIKLSVAIIGAGPAGYYTAEALTTGKPGVKVDILDKLPTPYGLIRAGVAPDHQSIKNVSKRYAATNDRENVRFVGNVSLGQDITMAELKGLYDVIILATGAPTDRPLGIEGEDLDGVIGSGAFVGWYNSHPDYADLNPDLHIASVAVIGNGNVAVDVARILAKTANEMKDTDLAAHAADAIHNSSSIKDIHVIGRRGPLEAAFTPKELGELNTLENCVTLLDPSQLPPASGDADLSGAAKKNMVHLRAIAENTADDTKIRLHLMFYAQPVGILGQGRACGLTLEKTTLVDGKAKGTGETEVLPAGLIVPCIGYRTSPIEDVPYDTGRGIFRSDEGRIDAQTYCVGWARRGPSGTIGTNKPDGIGIAAKILAEVKGGHKEGRVALDRLIAERNLHVVTFANWKKIEAAENSAATNGAPRLKMVDVDDMVSIAES